MTRTGVDVRLHLPAVLAGLHWLYDTPQPENAVVRLEDCGQSLATAGRWRLTFVPAGPSGTPRVVVDPAGRGGLSDSDIAELADSVEDFGEMVSRSGISGGVGFLELERPAHPSLRRAIERAEEMCAGGDGVAGRGRGVGVEDVRRLALRQSAELRSVVERWLGAPGSGSALAGAGRCTRAAAVRTAASRSLRLRCGGMRC